MNDLDRMVDADIDEAIEAKHTRHFSGGWDIRCGYQAKPKQDLHISLSWDSVTCPDCLAKKQDSEPWKAEIDTRGD